MPEKDLPKAYDASAVEDAIYAAWEASGLFNPDNLPDRNQSGEPYCIMMPPPNRTGTLHMGHASMLAIEDLLIRFHRMQGKRTLWVPGTDHAAISTQVKVEQLLIKEGMKDPRKELGREVFLQKVVAFAEGSANTIRNQVRKMGSSCDWSRERYTFDEERNHAVNVLFKMMVDDGLIERGYRVVNWDPQFQTTLSDDEVLARETTAKLLTFTYDADFPIAISTTRPETKFGDTAVAVHPDDARYKEYVGKTFTPTFCGKQISVKVIADVAVDPTFGTGALGVTPAHSMIDADMAARYELLTVIVIGPDGKMTSEAGADFAGLTVQEARTKVEQQLEQRGLLQKTEEISQNLPVAERGGGVVEQLPMRQWFIRVNKPFTLRQDTLNKTPSEKASGGGWQKGESVTLKELMARAVRFNLINIIPERFAKTYFHWIDNLRDWCISRQIWFGHQIPVWYKGDDVQVSDMSPGDGWERDPDTLDTWFSAGMWTFSALGWPDKDEWEKYRVYHPTAVLETGYDILFFWVARMVLMSAYAIGEVPFKDVYLHGLVRDEQGRKMSKSLGNVLDPLDLIPKYGTDAVRLSLLMGSTPGQDVKLSEAKVEGFRNFTNKLWNISRFILLSTEAEKAGDGQKTLADRWIIGRLNTVVASVTKKLERYEFSSAGEELRDFTWNDFADWYLEIAKVEGGKDVVLRQVLKTLLPLWHPFMPFVTEHIWKEMGNASSLMIAPWPVATSQETEAQEAIRFDILRELVTDARRLRAERGVEAAKQVEIVFVVSATVKKLVEENQAVITHLIRASSVACVDTAPADWATTVSGTTTIALNLSGAIDVEKERAKAAKELAESRTYADSLRAKLANEEFVSKAPAHVIEGVRAKLEEAEGKMKALEGKV